MKDTSNYIPKYGILRKDTSNHRIFPPTGCVWDVNMMGKDKQINRSFIQWDHLWDLCRIFKK